jgi:gluconate 2-dehydrogenase gamma chain
VSDMNRRDLVKMLAAVPIAGRTRLEPPRGRGGVAEGPGHAKGAKGGGDYTPTFFTPHEWETVKVLVDLVLPADERSGSATDAGVPEFMDFIVGDNAGMQVPDPRGGLAWLDTRVPERFERPSWECAASSGRRCWTTSPGRPAPARA